MEAVLDFGRGCQDLAIILLGGVGEGGAEMGEQASCPVIAFIGGSEKGRGRRGEGEQICPCTKCSHVHVVSILSLFLISPFCCCSLSRYKKVPRERYSVFKKFLRPCLYLIHGFTMCRDRASDLFRNVFVQGCGTRICRSGFGSTWGKQS